MTLVSCAALPFLSALGGGSSKSTDKSTKVDTDVKVSGRDSIDKKSLISSDKNSSFSNKGDNTIHNRGVAVNGSDMLQMSTLAGFDMLVDRVLLYLFLSIWFLLWLIYSLRKMKIDLT